MRAFLQEAFTGEGARLYGGRWNSIGSSVVYISQHLSLSALEMFVRLTSKNMGLAFCAIPVDVPDSLHIETIYPDDLPKDWREEPPPKSTQDIGDRWMRSGISAALQVPSVIVPVEFNFVINPLHSDFKKIKIGKSHHFSFDPRMWK